MKIVVDTKNWGAYKKDLDKISRGAYPFSVRQTLNEAAFDMKKNELHKSAKKNFDHTRNSSFFKKFSYVHKAKGFDINTMVSAVVMRDLGVKSAKEAVKNTPKHHYGGTVTGGTQYLNDTRISKNYGKLVRRPNYLGKQSILNDRKSKWIVKVNKAFKEKKSFWHTTNKGTFLIRPRIVKRTKTRGLRIKTDLLMRERTSIILEKNKFIKEAAETVEKRIPGLFKKEFKKRLDKYVARKTK